MKLTINPEGVLQFDDIPGNAIIYKNFKGEGDYSPGFALEFPDLDSARELMEGGWNITVRTGDRILCDNLSKEGWNAKYIPEMDANTSPRVYLPIKMKFSVNDNGFERGPAIYLETGDTVIKFTGKDVGDLDNLSFAHVPMMDVRPYVWTQKNGKPSISAWLNAIRIVQRVDRISACYIGRNVSGGGNDDEPPFEAN